MSFRVDIIPNRNSPPAVLLRQSWREGKKIRHKTIANLSKLPPALVDRIRTVVKGGIALRSLDEAISLRRALPHGHVAAVLGICRQLGMDRLLHRQPGRQRDLALGALIARVLAPDSKLATARRLSPETADTSLGPLLGLGPVTGNEMLNMLDWLPAAPALDRKEPRPPSPLGGHADPVRRHLQLSGGPLLSARRLRLQPRRQEGQEADRLRPALRRRRLSGGGGSVRR